MGVLSRRRADGQKRNVFGTRFWGFEPQAEPFCGFTYPGSQSSLIARSQPGDLLVILGTGNELTAPEQRGRLLGFMEFARTAVIADHYLTDVSRSKSELFDENGRFRWPYAVPALRVWKFASPPNVHEAIGRQLTMAATTGIDKLSELEADALWEFEVVEVEIPTSPIIRREQILRQGNAERKGSDRVGPKPSEWSAEVARCDGVTYTYAMQFGDYDLFKIGISQNPSERRDRLNWSVPHEIVEASWQVVMTQQWPDGASAYAMEQWLLVRFSEFVSGPERVRRSRRSIEQAFIQYLNELS